MSDWAAFESECGGNLFLNPHSNEGPGVLGSFRVG